MAIKVNVVKSLGVQTVDAHLIDDAVATGNGEWIDARGLTNYSFHTSGITTGTVVYSGSNAATKPAAATHGIALGSVTADGIDTFTTPVRWLKARVSAWTTGTFVTYLHGQARS